MVMSVSLDVYDSVVFKMFIFTTMNSTTTQRRLSMSCIAYFLVGLMQHASNQPKLLASQAYSQEGLQQALKRLKAARGPEERDNTTQLVDFQELVAAAAAGCGVQAATISVPRASVFFWSLCLQAAPADRTRPSWPHQPKYSLPPPPT